MPQTKQNVLSITKQLVSEPHELLCLILTVVIKSNGYFGHNRLIVDYLVYFIYYLLLFEVCLVA